MKQRSAAYNNNLQNILKLLEKNQDAFFCDLGCDNGEWTLELAKTINTTKIYGLEIINDRVKMAKRNGINVKSSDLNSKLPYDNNFFDVLHANQVIEHLFNTDNFVSEIHRVLKINGYVVISTENLASWHNIGSLLLGYMPFSLVNISCKSAAIGNPLAPHKNEIFWESSSWQHNRIFTIRGLNDLFSLYGFATEKVLCAGYYPFGNWPANIDKNHSAFISIKFRKVSN
jgi:SAM-dependent methyltransferase